MGNTGSTPKRRPKNAIKIRRKIHAIITGVTWSSRKTSSIPSANSAEQNCVQKHRIHSNQMEKKRCEDSSLPQRRKPKYSHELCPLSSQALHPRNKHLPSNPIFPTQKQHPDACISDCQFKDNGNKAPDSMCDEILASICGLTHDKGIVPASRRLP